MKAKFSGTYTPRYQRPLGTPNKLLPPKAYIGKGYGDKGTAQKPELDASPSWQDVARYVSNKERVQSESIQERIEAARTIEELVEVFEQIIKEGEEAEAKPTERRGVGNSVKNPAGTKKAKASW